MSKRARVLETLGNLPYTTIDGGRWLKKALDPADIDVEVAGLPDTNTNPRTVLNYQYQSDIPLPNPSTYDANVIQSYDVNFYVYQNPVLYGMSVSTPASFKPLTGGCLLTFNADGSISVPDGFCPATVQLFENNQIEGDNQTEKLDHLEDYCQKYRMIYGGVQCIPACSALFDSGTIEATQQIFSAKNGNTGGVLVDGGGSSDTDGSIYNVQIFNPNDFPDEGSSIQNPTTLYCRYKEGLYMPYKLRNPLVYPYKSSENYCLNEAPYVITNECFASITTLHSGSTHDQYVGLDYVAANRKFMPQLAVTNVTEIKKITWHLACYSKTGVKFYINWCWQVTGDGFLSGSWECTTNKTSPCYPCIVSGQFHGGSTQYSIWITNGSPHGGDLLVQNPYFECNIGVICFRSIGLQATIRVIFRMGVEMMITAGGIYSPFKHKSPKFDEKALSTYVRTTHSIRDAFLGNAATPEGHIDFANQLATMVMLDEGTNVSNLGSGWYGRVSV